MSDDYIKIKNQINNNILDNINGLKYVQNLRNGIEKYSDNSVEEFIDSIRYFILLNDIDMQTKKFVVFWIDFIIQNYSEKLEKKLKNKINDIIITLDLYPLLYDKNYTEQNKKYFNILDEISIKIREKNDKLLSNTQYYVRNKILENKNIVFAAPTSFGKSSIVIDTIQELIKCNKINKVLFILPTKALINEYRRKIKKKIENITIIENPHVIDNFEKVVYLFTPERFLVFYENNKNIKLDYVINDEAQILVNINKKKCVNRSILLAKTLSIVSNKKTPIIFLMPYISKPLDSFIFKYINTEKDEIIQITDDLLPFVSNNYYMLDVDSCGDLYRYDFSRDSGIEYASKKYIAKAEDNFNKDSLESWGNIIVDNLKNIVDVDKKTIIFCTNKNQIKLIANRMIKNRTCKMNKISYRMQALINYIEKNIGPEFEFIEFLKNGIAVHFSEIDSYMRRQVEIIFNEETDIKAMICTSTLLQGVNLNAQNLIMIYGKIFSSIGNVDIDYRNLIGRSARLGINIQGNIYNISCCKNIEKEGAKLYKSSEPVKINFDKIIGDVKKDENDIIKTYACDSEVKTKLKEELNNGENKKIDNLDYFIGYENAESVEKKINKYNIDFYIDLLKNIGNYEKTLQLIKELANLYEWKENKNFDIAYRMTNFEYLASLAINIFNGDNVQRIIEKNIKYVEKNNEYILVLCKNITGFKYVTMIRKEKFDIDKMKIFDRKRDINTYIYTVLYDVQNLVEFQLKKYIQDLYYRVKKINNDSIIEVEEILDYSTLDQKKIALNNVGIVDNFAIEMLNKDEYSLFFTEDGDIKVEELRQYAIELPEDDPMRYAILDVL
jgi:hypothetical protein